MCCIFTCFGWMIDLIQRFWTFLMSCCICSAVYCVLVVSAMAGIALGYNYSLAEYIDLKESNVSIFLKRGIFDDEIADLQLRRANDELLNRKAGMRSGPEAQIKDSDETATLRSGRRLDDSVFDGGDQYKYEGSLMKLTAKPIFEHTTPHLITGDSEMGSVIGSYTKDTLDSLKAIQSVVDARRAYAQTIRGPTFSPVPTYLFNEVERTSPLGPINQYLPAVRRMMSGTDNVNPTMNPARLAVPERNLGEDINWIGPLRPKAYENKFKELGIESERLTFPSAITYKAGPIRPTPTMSTIGEGAIFMTKYNPITLFSTRPTEEEEMRPYTKDPKLLSFKEKLMAENNRPIKKHKLSDEDYDYDVKGLPVRKRRSINNQYEHENNEQRGIPYRENKIIMQDASTDTKLDNEYKLNKHNILKHPSGKHEVDIFYYTKKIQKQEVKILPNSVKQNNISESLMESIDGQIQENITFGLEPTTKVHERQNVNGSFFQNMFTHIRTNLQLIKKRLSESSQNSQAHSASSGILIENDNIDAQIREAFFKNKTGSSKSNAFFKGTVNVTLAGNKTESAIKDFNPAKEVFMQPQLFR